MLDPIDGTRGYISGTPTWGVLIALTDAEGPVYGIIDQPYIGERFEGGLGRARLTGPRGARPLAVAPAPSLSEAKNCSRPFRNWAPRRTEQASRLCATVVRLTRYGMDCYAYALVAAGHVDLVIEAGLHPYDICAPIAVIRGGGRCRHELGGRPGPWRRQGACRLQPRASRRGAGASFERGGVTSLLIRNAACVVTMDDEGTEHRDTDIRIEHGEIVDLGQGLEASGPVIDAGGCLVTPGLVKHPSSPVPDAHPRRAGRAGCGAFRLARDALSGLGAIHARTHLRLGPGRACGTGAVGLYDDAPHLYLFPNGARLDDTIAAAREVGLRFHATRGGMRYRIAPGFRADLAIWGMPGVEAAGSWDAAALLLAGPTRVRNLIVEGAASFEAGVLKTLDLELVLRRQRALAEALAVDK